MLSVPSRRRSFNCGATAAAGKQFLLELTDLLLEIIDPRGCYTGCLPFFQKLFSCFEIIELYLPIGCPVLCCLIHAFFLSHSVVITTTMLIWGDASHPSATYPLRLVILLCLVAILSTQMTVHQPGHPDPGSCH